MPDLQVPFANVRQILTEFIIDVRHLGLADISTCPFGQAYVKMDNPFDRDTLVNQSPHVFGDVHIIFQKHNQGLNWRSLTLNRDIWIL